MFGAVKQSPFNQFSRLAGRYNSLAPFYMMSGQQQALTGDNSTIDLKCYVTKMYTTSIPITLILADGFQDGQLKKLSFVFKGRDSSNIVVNCPSLSDVYSRITFSEVGDFCILMWTGGSWVVIETGNVLDPASNTPFVN